MELLNFSVPAFKLVQIVAVPWKAEKEKPYVVSMIWLHFIFFFSNQSEKVLREI